MISNNTNAQNGNNQIVKFYGRVSKIPKTGAQFTACIEQLLSATALASETAHQTREPGWKALENDLSSLTNQLLRPEYEALEYQVELITEVVLPYLRKMKTHYYVDKHRFRQLSVIINSLLPNAMADTNTHPALVLQKMDDIVYELQTKQSMLWKSELLTALTSAVNKQWTPILHDHKVLLQNIAGKLILLGLIGAFGWPLALLYPMYRMTFNIMGIIQEWEQRKQLTPQAMFDLMKTGLLLFASMQIVSILSLYSQIGYCCLIGGVGAYFLSSNEIMLKQSIPAIAPHIKHVDAFMEMISTLDPSKISHIIEGGMRFDSLSGTAPQSNASHSTPMSDRVEVLNDDITPASEGNHTIDSLPVADPINDDAMEIERNNDEMTDAALIDAFENNTNDGMASSSTDGIRRRSVQVAYL